jgi:Fungal specific transcription factor domain
LIPSLRRLDLQATSVRTGRTTSEPTFSSSQSTLVQASRHGSQASSPAAPTSIPGQEQPIVFELPYPTTIGTPSDRLLELRLFHHYMQMSTSSRQWRQTLPPQNSLQGTWKQWVAGLAMKDHTLMDAVLGFSAANIGALNPSDRLVSQASYKYMLRAITGHAKQMRQGINDQNAEVLFATSTFMALFSSMVPPCDVRGPPLHVGILLYLDQLSLIFWQYSGLVPIKAREPLQKPLAGIRFKIPKSNCISMRTWSA